MLTLLCLLGHVYTRGKFPESPLVPDHVTLSKPSARWGWFVS